MPLHNHPDRIRITFDDHRLVNKNEPMRDVRQPPRLLNTPAAWGFPAMTMIAVTYGCARVGKTYDESKNLDTSSCSLPRTACGSTWFIPTWPVAVTCSVPAGRG